MENRLAKFNELVPSTLPFVEGKLEGHKERKNYSIVGPGVAEDSKQFIKIAMPHSFNFGAVSALPQNGSGLHSHTTAEVFVIDFNRRSYRHMCFTKITCNNFLI